MNRTQPNWDSLADINFLVRRRLIEHLNAAIGAINLIDTPEAAGKPAEFWKNHAMRHIMRAQHLYEAWNTLIRYKSGQRLTHMRQFRAGDLLEWMASETHQTYMAHTEHERLLAGNRETLQEALLLVHSAAYSIGPGVRLLTESSEDGFWFRVRYHAQKQQPATLDELFDHLDTDWRTESTAYELRRAQDFLEMNDSTLNYASGDGYGELSFFLPVVGAAFHHSGTTATQIEDETLAAKPTEEETHPSGVDIRQHFSQRTRIDTDRFSRTEN